MPHVSLISRLKGYFSRSQPVGEHRKFSKWYARIDERTGTWRVVNSRFTVVASDCTKENAESIADCHNRLGYDEWLYRRGRAEAS